REHSLRIGPIAPPPVCDHVSTSPIGAPIIRSDHSCITDEAGSKKYRRDLSKPIPGAAKRVPLRTASLNPVDIYHDGRSSQTPEDRKRAIGGVAEENDVKALPPEEIEKAQERVDRGIEILVADGREHPKPHSPIVMYDLFSGIQSAIHGYFMPSSSEPRRQLFGEGLKSTIPRRDSANPQDRNSQSALPLFSRLHAEE